MTFTLLTSDSSNPHHHHVTDPSINPAAAVARNSSESLHLHLGINAFLALGAGYLKIYVGSRQPLSSGDVSEEIRCKKHTFYIELFLIH